MKWLALFLAAVSLAGCGRVDQRVVVAAGTTLVDSGLLDELVSAYEARNPGVKISVVGEATAQVLVLGRRGGADLLITHVPQAEESFVAEGRAVRYEPVLESRFVLVGPPDLIARLPGRLDDALRTIVRSGRPFVTRADGSGTYVKELELWPDAGIDPTGQGWYVETGQGMGLTLQVTDQRQGFTLSELGAFLAARHHLGLAAAAFEDDQRLANLYHLIVVAGTPSHEAAGGFASWLVGSEGKDAILAANRKLFGDIVYAPAG